MFWRKVYGLLGRSTLILLSWGKCEERKELMQARTLSCQSLYHHFNRATLQLFSTWCRDCSLLQSWHCGDDNFFHKNRFMLYGSVLVTAFRANLKTRSGRDCTVEDQRSAGLPGKSRTNWPSTSSPALWDSRAALSAACTFALTGVMTSLWHQSPASLHQPPPGMAKWQVSSAQTP